MLTQRCLKVAITPLTLMQPVIHSPQRETRKEGKRGNVNENQRLRESTRFIRGFIVYFQPRTVPHENHPITTRPVSPIFRIVRLTRAQRGAGGARAVQLFVPRGQGVQARSRKLV